MHFFVKQGIFKLLWIVCCLIELAPNLEILSIFIRSLLSREVSVAEDKQKLIAWDKSGVYLGLVNIRLFKHSSNHVLLYQNSDLFKLVFLIFVYLLVIYFLSLIISYLSFLSISWFFLFICSFINLLINFSHFCINSSIYFWY